MADQGNIGIGRAIAYRKLTDHQASPSGIRRNLDSGTRRKLTDHQASPSGIKRPGLPAANWRKLVQTQTYHEQYWYSPCVMNDARGFLYWAKGSNALFRIADAAEDPRAETGWRWVRPGVARFRWFVAVGENTINLSLIQSGNHAPRPTLRVLANDALGIAETIAVAGPETDAAQILSLAVTATTAGVATLQIEWWATVERNEVIWEKLIIS